MTEHTPGPWKAVFPQALDYRAPIIFSPAPNVPLLGHRPTTALRGRIAQIVDRLNALSRQPGIAHTAQARLLQLDARDLEAIMQEYLR